MNSKFSYTGSSPVERVAEAAPTEETGEQRVADRNAQSVKETLRFHKQKIKKLLIRNKPIVPTVGCMKPNMELHQA